MSKVKIAVLESQVNRLLEKQKELTERVRANEKVVAAIGLLGSVVIAILGTGIFQKAEACSPPRDSDGNMLPFTCPSHDTVILEEPKEITEDEPRYINDWNRGKVVLIDTRDDKPLVIMETYHHMVDAIRNWKQEKERTPIEDMINTSLAEYENGSNGSTESEELLQLPSNGDQQSFRW
jgi:hypothetical protein